ncbi:MAG: branched-chain amino acid transaminase [Solirubrobacterales bacterium]|nr:branched-chain amino acid transaminase [Solirubrobacterales bacterium]
MEEAEYIWQSGKFVPWDEAQVHVLSHGLHYGTGVFEGVRCYDGEQGPAIFRHKDHLKRLEQSAEMYYLDLPYSTEEIGEATRELVRKNGLRDCYIRPLAFRGYGEMGLFAKSAPVELIIAAWPWGAYLGEEGVKHGIRAKVSSWRRVSGAGLVPHAKASGQYLNSILAKTESANAGYEEAILLDDRGFVCEGSGENIFVVKDGKVATPPQVASILDGITRKSVMQILEDRGYTCIERDLARSELYTADEVFMCGTAAEIVPVREIDDHPLGEPGEVTRMVQAKFNDAIYGRAPEYSEWLDLVGEPEKTESGSEPSTVTS